MRLQKLSWLFFLILLIPVPLAAAPGDLDTTFGTGRMVVTPIGASDDEAHAVAVQPADGKIVVAGWYVDGSNSRHHLAVVRYNPNGSLDTSFGTAGKATF